MSRLKVGFIGLGNIGKPMALNLPGEAMEVWVYDLNPQAVAELVAKGALAAGSPAEVAAQADLIGICVRDDADVEAVLCGQDGILSRARPGTVVAIHSTVKPETVQAMAARGAECGVQVIDAPITGGASGAQARTLGYMVGGPVEALEAIRPMLACSAREINHAGGLGMGMALKLCINQITYAQFIAIYEAMRLAKAAGLDPQLLKQVGQSNGHITPLMAQFLGLMEYRSLMTEEQFQGLTEGFSAVAEKDLSLALELARRGEQALPGCENSLALIRNVYTDSY